MVYRLDQAQSRNFEVSSRKEWLLTDGVGGYAMGTPSGANTRRYHGHLVAAVHPPVDRMVLLANVEAFVQGTGGLVGISTNQYAGAVYPEGYLLLDSFEVNEAAVWTWKGAGLKLEKRLTVEGAGACTIQYCNLGTAPLEVCLRPLVLHRPYHSNFKHSEGYPAKLTVEPTTTEVRHDGIVLRIEHPGATATALCEWYYRIEHLRDYERGLDPYDDLFCPCELRYRLPPQGVAILVASVDPQPPREAEKPMAVAKPTLGESLKEAASKFVVRAPSRSTIIAGYPWFGDWGRDTMIALPGICLHTGRWELARRILLDYVAQMRGGLIPNRFVESGQEPEFNTVDATLWMVQAAFRTLDHQWDDELAGRCRAAFEQVFSHHVAGTAFGISVDRDDGLLAHGHPSVQLTWMDARVGDEVVTPRDGKAVEINGLWINALHIMGWLEEKLDGDPSEYQWAEERARASFARAFWRDQLGYYLDVAQPDDDRLRPNQVIAMALPFGPCRSEHASLALAAVARELLTPRGLRTLSPRHADYRGRYDGPLAELDRRYHQGTVWPWLLGPYCSAVTRFGQGRKEVRRILRQSKAMLIEYGLGGIAEVYDGDMPQQPGGCPWQAWSVGEVLRAWFEDAGGD